MADEKKTQRYVLYGLGLIKSVEVIRSDTTSPTLFLRAMESPSDIYARLIPPMPPFSPSLFQTNPDVPLSSLLTPSLCARWIDDFFKSLNLHLVAHAATATADPQLLLSDLLWEFKQKWESGEMCALMLVMDITRLADTPSQYRLRVMEVWVDVLSKSFKDATNLYASCTCPVCLDDFAHDDLIMELPACRHVFHRSCIHKWFKTRRTCPYCTSRVKIRLGVWVRGWEAISILSDPLWSQYLVRQRLESA